MTDLDIVRDALRSRLLPSRLTDRERDQLAREILERLPKVVFDLTIVPEPPRDLGVNVFPKLSHVEIKVRFKGEEWLFTAPSATATRLTPPVPTPADVITSVRNELVAFALRKATSEKYALEHPEDSHGDAELEYCDDGIDSLARELVSLLGRPA